MPVLLSCQSLSKSFSARPLFQNISLGVEDGERLGLIGPNGSGKSTLLRIWAGLETSDAGTLSARRSLRLGYVRQDEDFAPGATVESVLNDALADTTLEDAERSVAVETMLGRMEFADRGQTAHTLSGGWRKRLALAQVLIREPDLLLLDEPTNHLDMEGVLWLEKLLQNAPFAFVLVSHDRAFLQNVTSRVVELNPAYADGFLSVQGHYSDFLARREEYLDAQAQQEHTLKKQVSREIEWLRRGPQARTTKAQYRIDEAGRLIQSLAEVKQRNAQGAAAGLDFNASGRKTRDLLVAKDVTKTLGGRTLFSELSFTLSPGVRLGLIGANGSGKTTLLRVLTGETQPDHGTVKPAEGLRIVKFDQDRASLDTSATLRQALAPDSDTVTFRGSVVHVSSWARRFRFRTEQLHQPLSVFSGGEQARVLIAQLMLKPADVLILDEPTNDLDIPTLEVLEESLESFPGALVLVTHDRYLLDHVATDVLALDGEGGARFFADYAQWQSHTRPVVASAPPSTARTAAAPASRLSTAERREWKNIEEKIEAAEQHVADLETMLTDPVVASDHVRLQQCWNDLEAGKQAVTHLYARWEELEAKQG